MKKTMEKKKSKKTILKAEEIPQCRGANKILVINVAPFLCETEVLKHLKSQNPNVLKCTQCFDRQGVRTPSFLVEFNSSEKSYNLTKIRKIKNILVSWEAYAGDSEYSDICNSTTCINKGVVPQEEKNKKVTNFQKPISIPKEEMKRLYASEYKIAEGQRGHNNMSDCSETKVQEQQLVKQKIKKIKKSKSILKNETSFQELSISSESISSTTSVECIKEFVNDMKILVKEIHDLMEICDLPEVIKIYKELKEKLYGQQNVICEVMIMMQIYYNCQQNI